MTESTARQLFELLSAFLTGVSIAILDLPFRLLRRICPRFGVLWDFLFYAIAGFLVFAAGQWCGGGVRLRFLTAALLGAALCAWVLRSLRSALRRAAARKEALEDAAAGKMKKTRRNA